MKRIVDERPNSPEAALLRAASGRAVPSRARKRALASVTIAVGTLGTTTTTAAATSTMAAAWIKGAIGIVVVAVGVSTGVALRSRATDAPAPAPAVLSSAPKAPIATAIHPPAGTAPIVEDVVAPPAIVAPSELARPTAPSRPAAVAPAPSSVEPVAPPKVSSLGDEIARIEAAKNATNRGNATEALAALDAYAAAYPSGKLRQEADALRIRALVLAGRRDEASRALGRFRTSYPTSPHTSGLESLVAN